MVRTKELNILVCFMKRVSKGTPGSVDIYIQEDCQTVKALRESLFEKELGKPIGQLIVICGWNKTLSSSLQALE
jgi:hypothetical protein